MHIAQSCLLILGNCIVDLLVFTILPSGEFPLTEGWSDVWLKLHSEEVGACDRYNKCGLLTNEFIFHMLSQIIIQ